MRKCSRAVLHASCATLWLPLEVYSAMVLFRMSELIGELKTLCATYTILNTLIGKLYTASDAWIITDGVAMFFRSSSVLIELR